MPSARGFQMPHATQVGHCHMILRRNCTAETFHRCSGATHQRCCTIPHNYVGVAVALTHPMIIVILKGLLPPCAAELFPAARPPHVRHHPPSFADRKRPQTPRTAVCGRCALRVQSAFTRYIVKYPSTIRSASVMCVVPVNMT